MNYSYKIQIANPCDVVNRVQALKRKSSDIKSRLAPTLKKLWNPERELLVIQNQIDFEELKDNFPHFIEVIEFYESTVRTLAKINSPFEIPPVLLQGEPGLGKTYFANKLAQVLGLPFHEISLATTTANFALSGGNTQWGEGTTGFICNTLAESIYANPLILIDEIDKCTGSTSYNPMNVFYSLLETHTAVRFRDEALEINIDASKIIWIASGNYIEQIPDPILSRMRVFRITQPAPKAMKKVVKKIYSHLLQSKPYGKLINSNIDDSVVDLLSYKTPRDIKISIEEAINKALRADRNSLCLNDLPAQRRKYHVGFI